MSSWNRFALTPAGSTSLSGGIAAVSRIPTSMEVWSIRPDGSVQDSYWYEGSQWNHFTLALASSASPEGGITAVSRIPGSMEVWWIGQNGSVQDKFWYDGGQWNGFELAPAGSARHGIKAVSRVPNSMEVWWVGQDASVQDAFWYEGSQWNRYTLVPAGSASMGGIAAVARVPSSMEVWWVGADGSIQDNNWYDSTPFPDSRKWDKSITFADSTALGGSCTLVVNNKGDWTFNGHLHDSGWDPYTFSIVAVLLAPSGIGYTFKLNGHTDGTGSTFPAAPNRDFNWINSDNNPSLRNNWAQVAQAVFKVTVVAQDVTAQTASDLLQQALQELIQAGIKAGVAFVVALL